MNYCSGETLRKGKNLSRALLLHYFAVYIMLVSCFIPSWTYNTDNGGGPIHLGLYMGVHVKNTYVINGWIDVGYGMHRLRELPSEAVLVTLFVCSISCFVLMLLGALFEIVVIIFLNNVKKTKTFSKNFKRLIMAFSIVVCITSLLPVVYTCAYLLLNFYGNILIPSVGPCLAIIAGALQITALKLVHREKTYSRSEEMVDDEGGLEPPSIK
jgi:hypothetical protein